MQKSDFPERKENRLKEYDYSGNGAYFITICTKDMKCVLSRIVGDGDVNKSHHKPVGATCGRPQVKLTDFGIIVNEEIEILNKAYCGVTVERYVIMPNHIHLLIMIDIEYGRPQVAPTVSRIVQQFKGSITKKIGIPIWQKGFYDHVIRDYDDFLIRWQYIDENPKKWLLGKDKYNG